MSISDDVRAQQTRATKLSTDISADAKDLRKKVSGLEWQAGAALSFKAVAISFAFDLDQCSDDAATLATDLGHQADTTDGITGAIHSVAHAVTFGLIH